MGALTLQRRDNMSVATSNCRRRPPDSEECFCVGGLIHLATYGQASQNDCSSEVAPRYMHTCVHAFY